MKVRVFRRGIARVYNKRIRPSLLSRSGSGGLAGGKRALILWLSLNGSSGDEFAARYGISRRPADQACGSATRRGSVDVTIVQQFTLAVYNALVSAARD